MCCSGTTKFLINQYDSMSIKDYIKNIKQTKAEISFHGESYHFETRSRVVNETYTEQTSSGPKTMTRSRVEYYQEKVVTGRY